MYDTALCLVREPCTAEVVFVLYTPALGGCRRVLFALKPQSPPNCLGSPLAEHRVYAPRAETRVDVNVHKGIECLFIDRKTVPRKLLKNPNRSLFQRAAAKVDACTPGEMNASSGS